MTSARGAVRCVVLGCLLAFVGCAAFADELATITGRITDPHSLVVAGVKIDATNINTNITYSGESNADGLYRIPGIPPGAYRVIVQKTGFAQIVKPGVDLHVQDVITLNFTMQVGSVSQSITVEGGAPLINTESAAVSTIVDHNFVENMPLNGRSFQDLILLTPGVVTGSPQQQQPTAIGNNGEFSVNGQRTESNYYTVDGVSANTGTTPASFGPGNTGSVPAATALGTTQALVSIDSLEEFRIQSSTYSAEYGRSPGGQFAFATRSGTNQWHGTAFEYLRNDYFDANNWFNDFFKQSAPPLRQNDFGGTLGGPIEIPKLYDGKDRTFFFFSYEGLRLIQPQASTRGRVADAYLRTCAAAPLRQVWNAFPQPSVPGPAPDCTKPDPNAEGAADFISTWSNPASLDAYSVRLDNYFGSKLKVFFRFGDTPSVASSRLRDNVGIGGTPSVKQAFESISRLYTFGATAVLSPRISNDLRLGYSSTSAHLIDSIDTFGGAVPVDLGQLQQLSNSPAGYHVEVDLFTVPTSPAIIQNISSALQRQWNVTDSLTVLFGQHQLKFGFDYRRLTPVQGFGLPNVSYQFFSVDGATANTPDSTFLLNGPAAYPLYTNFSAFVQDEWKIRPRLNLSIGLRWEVNPPPDVTQGIKPYTVEGADNLATMILAPQGTPLWKTTWFNFAPRLGVAYVAHQTQGRETVVRAGGGLFFDTGQQLGSEGFQGVGVQNSASPSGSQAAFPTPPSSLPPAVTTPVAPYSTVYAYPPHLQLPYTIQWNAAIEQALGPSQSASLTYVGSHAGRLLENNQVHVTPFNSNFGDVVFFQNGLTADYHALQGQYKRRLSRGLTALASYTWSHAIDYGSYNFAFPYRRGNSDFDVRHSFSSAFSYDLPNALQSGLGRALLNLWGFDARFMARTGFPVTLNGAPVNDPATGQRFNAGLNLVSGVPLYLSGAQFPGGRSINPDAFSLPPSGTVGDAPRNFVRGFGAWQMNVAVRREFPLYEQLKLQFRAEAFNIFNHPGFGTIDSLEGSSTFGQAISTLNASIGGLSSLYQSGGPRSMQFSLRVAF